MNKTGEMAADPQLALVGLPEADDEGELLVDIAESAVFGAFESIPRPRRKDTAVVAEAVRKSVRAAINNAWGKKPVCSVMVSVV
jgi:ribonuclease J